MGRWMTKLGAVSLCNLNDALKNQNYSATIVLLMVLGEG
jgi:hypothetical protein